MADTPRRSWNRPKTAPTKEAYVIAARIAGQSAPAGLVRAPLQSKEPNMAGRKRNASEPKPSRDNATETVRRSGLARRPEGTPPEVSSPKDRKIERGAAQDVFLEAFGTANGQLVRGLLGQVFAIAPDGKVGGALAALRGIGPRDELEGLLAVQMVGVHHLA